MKDAIIAILTIISAFSFYFLLRARLARLELEQVFNRSVEFKHDLLLENAQLKADLHQTKRTIADLMYEPKKRKHITK